MYYLWDETDSRITCEARYYNCDGINICVVASLTKDVNWAGYIGAVPGDSEEDAAAWCLRYGCKMTEVDARHYFGGEPFKDLPYRS